MERLAEDNRLRIVEREKNTLKEKKREAEDYLRLMNGHVRALSRLWQWYLRSFCELCLFLLLSFVSLEVLILFVQSTGSIRERVD